MSTRYPSYVTPPGIFYTPTKYTPGIFYIHQVYPRLKCKTRYSVFPRAAWRVGKRLTALAPRLLPAGLTLFGFHT